VLQNNEKVKNCKDFEEEEGRINCDMQHRFVVAGGPFVQAGAGMQEELVKNVRYFTFDVSPSHRSSSTIYAVFFSF
jgi:hypothetical protein